MRRLLVIEDDLTLAEVTMRFLEREGYGVDVAHTFSAGLVKTKERHYDCGIVDLGLPDADIKTEFDTIRRLRELGLPIVVTTASGNPGLMAAAKMAGAAYVPKAGSGEDFPADLLRAEIKIKILESDPSREAEVEGYDAMRRIVAQKSDHHASAPTPISSLGAETPVKLNLVQMWAMIVAIVVATAVVVGTNFDLRGQIKDVKRDQQDIRRDQLDNAKDVIRQFEEIKVGLRAQAESVRDTNKETKERVADWTPWRQSVTYDLRRLGEATKTPITTTAR